MNSATDTLSGDTRTLADLQKRGFKNLPTEMIKDISYLEQLGSTTSTPIQDWPVIQILAPLPRGDRRKINKLFFERQKEFELTLDKTQFERLEASLFKTAQMIKEERITQLNDTITYYQRDIDQSQKQINKKISAVFAANEELRGWAREASNPILDEIKTIQAQGFWELTQVHREHVFFVTRGHVVVRYFNAGTGEDMQVDFGRIEISLGLKSRAIEAHAFGNNLILNGHFHPFISRGGSICFGSAANTAHDALVTNKFADLMSLTATLLTTYDPKANPYQSLISWWYWVQDGNAKRTTPGKCQNCKGPEGRCGCYFCDECAVWFENSDHTESHRCSECSELDCVCDSDPDEQANF